METDKLNKFDGHNKSYRQNKFDELEKLDIKRRGDRIGKYLKAHIEKFAFDKFSEDYIKRCKMGFMRGVPVPFRTEDIKALDSGSIYTRLSISHIGENMAWIMGIDPHFPYTDHYIEFIKINFRNKAAAALNVEAKNAAEKENFDSACIHFRAALCVEPGNLDAMYGYARVCRAMYLESDDADYIGNFKAEALEFFELTTWKYPNFSMAYYYLGYAYLNMGLYQKAYITWKDYIKKSTNAKERKEINERLEQLSDPVEIERGCNAAVSGRWDEGITILEPYLGSKYKDWWPLYYYLGASYANKARVDEAVAMFKQALRLNPSHVESMDELAGIYEFENQKELSDKYRNKAELIRRGGYEG
ncbi:MAG: tetratricopeptide repeat protein [Clostridiales Family XIII bacterium]|jgi:hypothetical protein|nr:tetratricopeptide repeat protein [Clostridiales Family XIII bacterium]